jgi:hypothetical protein
MSATIDVPLGTVHGGVWVNDATHPPCFGATCPACDWWQTWYVSPETAAVGLSLHERHDCQARVDGGER